MAVAGLLAQYLSINAQLTDAERQKTRWDNLATAMEKKLGEQTKAEEKWESQYDSAHDAWEDPSAELKLNGNIILAKDENKVKKGNLRAMGEWRISSSEKFGSKFASKKVPKYDPKLLEEYSDLDIEYGTMAATYQALVEELTAQRDGLKEQVSTEAKDTHMLGGG